MGKINKVFSKSWKVLSDPRHLCTFTVNKKEINEPQAISNALYDFYQTLFKVWLSLSEESIQSPLDKVPLPKLDDNQALECEGIINKNELIKALTSMDNNKPPRYDDITKKNYLKF